MVQAKASHFDGKHHVWQNMDGLEYEGNSGGA